MFFQRQKKWEKLGLTGAILSSKSDIPFNQSLISTFFTFWSPTSNYFLLSEGPMWVTLVDIYHLLDILVEGDIILHNFSDPSRSSFNYPSEFSHLSYTTFLTHEMCKPDSEVTF